MVKSLPTMQETQVQSLGQEDPLEKEMQPTLGLLPGKPHEQRSLVGFHPWGHKRLRHVLATNTRRPTFKGLLLIKFGPPKMIYLLIKMTA